MPTALLKLASVGATFFTAFAIYVSTPLPLGATTPIPVITSGFFSSLTVTLPASLLKIILALLPPNANELFITLVSSFSCALLGQKSIFPAFSASLSISSSLNPSVGTTVLVVSALIENIASIAPAAPRQCPVIAFVELTERLSFSPSNIVCSDKNSASSFLAVPVPCALTYPMSDFFNPEFLIALLIASI